jgi:hypothetical protein
MLAATMVTALIVLGVIAFLALDAYVLHRVIAGRRSADDYGSLPVPGEATMTLPAGRVILSYQEAYKASGGEGHIDFGVPSGVEVSVVAPSGERLEIKGPGFRGMGAVTDTGSNWSRARVGTVEITQPGDHTITTRGELEGAIEPLIVVGR